MKQTNNSCNNNCNNFNRYYDLIYNNIYINKIINEHSNYYKIFQNQRDFKNFEIYKEFKYKEYLSDIYTEDSNFDLALLPKNIETLSFKGQEIKSDIPSHIKTLKIFALKNYNWSIFKNASNLETLFILRGFGSMKIDQFQASDLPSSITDLYIDNYEFPITSETIPKNVKKLDLSLSCDTPIPVGSLPESITYLKLIFDGTIAENPFQSNFFPSNILKLDLSENNFQQLPDHLELPNSITSLKLVCGNLSSKFKFPTNLKSLSLHTEELKEDSGPVLPQTLEKLYLITGYQHPPSNKILPRSLKKLKVNLFRMIDSNGTPILCDSIQHLTLTSELYDKRERRCLYQKIFPNMLPNSLTYLYLDDSIGNCDNFYSISDEENVFPASLTHIRFGNQFQANGKINLNKLINLKKIEFGNNFNQPIDFSNLENLQSLKIYNHQYDKLPILVPKHTKVECSSYYKQFEESPLSLYTIVVPLSVSSLSVLSLQNKSNLECLDLGYGFRNVINKEDLPINNNIKTLILSAHFKSELNLDYFPSLEILKLNYYSRPILKSSTNSNLKSIIVPSQNVPFLDSIVDTPFQNYLNITLDNN